MSPPCKIASGAADEALDAQSTFLAIPPGHHGAAEAMRGMERYLRQLTADFLRRGGRFVLPLSITNISKGDIV